LEAQEAAMREPDDNRVYSSRNTRQGEIILRTPLRRAIFIVGLAGLVILGLVVACVPDA
jgi:hypothetical protein